MSVAAEEPGGGTSGTIPGSAPGQPGGPPTDPRLALLQEMRVQNFDLIRFASYRTACKLRFVQKKVNLHAVDIWNVIEAFRENGLNTLEPQCEVSVARLETLLSSLYHSLNKRLPPAHQVRAAHCCALLLNWLLAAYCPPGENVGKIRVFSIKVALATMCAGKLVDKLRYVFSQVSDGTGQLSRIRLGEYLREALALPAAVYESPSFPYSDNLTDTLFPGRGKVTVNDFMDTMMSDPGPACLVWLPLLHRLASVENVVHPTACSACGRARLAGFRYRCSRCHNYTLCQDCFWRGRVSDNHTNEHEVKEYATYSPSKQIGHSLRKSFRCVPERSRQQFPRFPDQPEKTLNLSHIVPPSPVAMHNGFPDAYGGHLAHTGHTGSLDSRAPRPMHHDMGRGDDEHRLIARYAARLAQHNTMPRSGRSASLTPDLGRGMVEGLGWNANADGARAQRELISQLEAKNREIMQEITRLRRQQEAEGGGGNSGSGELVGELRALRQRKGELEGHLSALQDSRRHLMGQLEGLMKMLKNQQSSPRSTPTSSPRSAQSPPPSGFILGAPNDRGNVIVSGPRSAPQTPSLGERDRLDMSCMSQSLAASGVEGALTAELRSNYTSSPRNNGASNGAPSPAPGNRSLRTDLLFAADSVTNAMSTLVRELNSEGSEDEAPALSNIRKPLDFEEDGDDDDGGRIMVGPGPAMQGGDEVWRGELARRLQRERFLAELRARDPDPQSGKGAPAEVSR
ncbi:dystrobrevin isoform X2 [Arctopsyche grandis]|uniref:dystrobrevin isoform X2 n=1 Tax=Arctopsyche grandis TaxID=121162 RepID=UPI00406D846C